MKYGRREEGQVGGKKRQEGRRKNKVGKEEKREGGEVGMNKEIIEGKSET